MPSLGAQSAYPLWADGLGLDRDNTTPPILPRIYHVIDCSAIIFH